MTPRTITRMDTSMVGRWWWTVDKWMLAAIALLLVVGVMLNLAAGPPAAERIGADGAVVKALEDAARAATL